MSLEIDYSAFTTDTSLADSISSGHGKGSELNILLISCAKHYWFAPVFGHMFFNTSPLGPVTASPPFLVLEMIYDTINLSLCNITGQYTSPMVPETVFSVLLSVDTVLALLDTPTDKLKFLSCVLELRYFLQPQQVFLSAMNVSRASCHSKFHLAVVFSIK